MGIVLYNDELENVTSKRELLRGKGVSVTLADDNVLDRIYLEKQLLKAGALRITGSGGMSSLTAGGAHDGEYPLRRYCKIVEVEAETS